MPDVKSGQAVISLPVLRVHDHTDLSAGLSSGNRGGIIQTASVGVVGPQAQAGAKAAIHIYKATVEMIDAGSKEDSSTAQLGSPANHRTWEVLCSSRKTRWTGRCGANGGYRLIGIAAQHLMVAVRSDVAHAEAYVAG